MLCPGRQCVHAACTYDAEADRIWVENYTEAFPCTPGILLFADRMNDWGKVNYDRATDTYAVGADLYIGRNDGTDTYFQIGSNAHPRETLVLRGNLVVYPFYITGENREKNASLAKRGVNRITLGSPDDGSIKATLKIHSDSGAKHSMYFGRIPVSGDIPRWGCYGGQLCVHNSTITAAVQDRAHAIGEARTKQVYLYGNRVVLENATLSWFAGVITFGMRARSSTIEGCVFEYSGYGIINPKQVIHGCTFRDLHVAVKDWGGVIDAQLIDCTFEDNDANWWLSRGRIICIDCTFGEPRKGNRLWRNERLKLGKDENPTFTSRRHIIVEVVDAEAKPVPGVHVQVRSEHGQPETVYNGRAVTDESGRTPGRGGDGAILLTERVMTATEAPDEPEVADYAYEVRVTASGDRTASVSDVRPHASWKVFRVVLKE